MILVDGVEGGTLPVTDSIVQRGDGVFEAMRSRDGAVFALDEHLDRLERSAGAMQIDLPDRGVVASWAVTVAETEGDALVRILVSRGDPDGPPRCVVLSQPLPVTPDPFTVGIVPAPWHPAGRRWELAGVKTVSYAPNRAATRVAEAAGFCDALLVSDDGIVLEGPTFSVAWVRDGVFETPALDLGILASITRAQVMSVAGSLGIEIREGRWPVSDLESATDLMALSTVKQVTPIAVCDGVAPRRTDVSSRLAAGLADLMDRDLAVSRSRRTARAPS